MTADRASAPGPSHRPVPGPGRGPRPVYSTATAQPSTQAHGASVGGPERIAVFLDYENVHRTGHSRYARLGEQHYETVVNPIDIAERIVAKRKLPGHLDAVHVFRGRPLPQYQPEVTSANDAQAAAWERDPRLKLTRRTLKYTDHDDGTYTAQEKGIDVALAVAVVSGAIQGSFDVGIVFSNDTDQLPALDFAFHGTSPRIEIACWTGAKPLWFPEYLAQTPRKQLPYCHFLDEGDFLACRDQTHY